MRQRAPTTYLIATGLIVGAILGILVGVLFPDDVNFAIAMVSGAAFGIVVASVVDLLFRNRDE